VDEYRIDQALKAYERIEDGLVEFSEHVPIVAANEGIQSPALISGIVDACGLLDSLFRDMTPDPATVTGKTKRRRDCDSGWFSAGFWNVNAVLDDARNGSLPDAFIVQTRLFATPVGKRQFPSDMAELHPGFFQCKSAFIEFLGRSY
jgi:hypothetical protein